MARQGITFEQVAAVADALAGEGQQPTIRAVREKLGDTGSPNTIHKHLTAWRAANGQFEHRVAAQGVGVVAVGVAAGGLIYPLPEQVGQRVIDV